MGQVQLCVCVCVCVCVGVCVFAHACLGTQPWLILCNSMNCSPPGFSVHGIFQARILEQVAISSSKGFPDPRIEPTYLSPPALADGFFTTAPPGKSSSVGQWFRSRILNSTAIKNAAIFLLVEELSSVVEGVYQYAWHLSQVNCSMPPLWQLTASPDIFNAPWQAKFLPISLLISHLSFPREAVI